MSFTNLIFKRSISLSCVRAGKRNFKKFSLFNKRGTRIFKQQQTANPDPEIPIDTRGVRETGYKVGDKFVSIQEMIPEMIVPDLKDCKLKPYVSYKTPNVIQEEFTPQNLFDAVYGTKIKKDFKEGKLNEDGSPKEPSNEENLDPSTAYLKARQTGSDIF